MRAGKPVLLLVEALFLRGAQCYRGGLFIEVGLQEGGSIYRLQWLSFGTARHLGAIQGIHSTCPGS